MRTPPPDSTLYVVSRPLCTVPAIVVAGLVAGVAGGLLSLINIGVETLAMGHRYFDDPIGVTGVPLWRRLAAPIIGGVLAGLIWWRLRRRGPLIGVKKAVRAESPERLTLGTVVDAIAQVIAVGAGTSLGRETAPRQITAYLGQVISDRFKLGPGERRTLIATTSAAGLSAVYNVPFAGMFYALELLLKPDLRTRRGWLQVLSAAVVSALATVTAWLFNHNHPIYELPKHALAVPPVGWLALVAVLGLAIGASFTWTNNVAKKRTAPPHRVWWTLPLGSALVTAIALAVPQIPGNGQIIVQAVLTPPAPGASTGILIGGLALGSVLLMGVAKWVGTYIAQRLGATGGVLTPALALGACMGAGVAFLSGHSSLADLTMFGVVGAACVLSVSQKAPLFAAAFTLELVKAPLLMILTAAACVAATWVLRVAATKCWEWWKARPGSADPAQN